MTKISTLNSHFLHTVQRVIKGVNFVFVITSNNNNTNNTKLTLQRRTTNSTVFSNALNSSITDPGSRRWGGKATDAAVQK